ncbi:Threonine/homoserine/homoserine lactone efflux protein [Pseudomonas frederiksbergensis]|uniref:Threonine/homoserine/homoserine lactone efflux protein n=1 Tax=Pseudomonas frederiksbergensis TaxID=104087 RepID=A0A1P8F3H5_9PSED|nr:LysE family transporter [Pseudomonas frederiksbergensis]APV43025.1 threonine transporter [Pseudomonas frederiksbergensis]SED43878.1 Threonine/homoserine/homoserine lactone efflux protein [Pseudomonas frederiksbergensis]
MQDFQQSLLFSMMLSISFGPIALIVLRQSVLFGRMSAVPSALGAAIADVLYAAVALMSATLVSVFVFQLQGLLIIASIVYLFYLGVKIFMSAGADISVSQQAGFISVFALTITNPLTIVAITSYVFANHSGGAAVNIPAFLSGFFIGSFTCQMVYVLGGGAVSNTLSGRVNFKILSWLSGFYLIAFSIWKLHHLISGEMMA